MSLETWLIGAGAVGFLGALAFEVWKDLTFIRLMLDHLNERRHRREMEDREFEADLLRAKRSAAAGRPTHGPAPEDADRP